MNFYQDIDGYGERTAIITETGEELTYRQFLQDADSFFGGLEERSLLFLICSNCLESVCAYIGALRKKVVPVMINSGIDRELYRRLFDTYRPDYVCAPGEWAGDGEADGEAATEIASYRGYKMYRTSSGAAAELHPELAMLLTTSGSTGSQKMVRQSYRNISSNAESIAAYLEIRETDRAITTMPMSYTYGLSIINSHLLRGAAIVVNNYSVVQKEFWELFRQTEPTTFGGVPFIYETLKTLRFGRLSTPSLRYITQAGGKMSKELVEEFNGYCREKDMKLIVMYGQTEATARMSYLPWEYADKKPGSIGIAIPGGAFSLLGEDGSTVEEANVTGELIYRGDNVVLGYAQGYEDLKLGDENHGILHTGDMAFRDEDGFYYIAGRKKRFLKMYGNRVNLDEVQEILCRQGYECVCGGEDDALKIYTTVSDAGVQQEMKAFIANALGLSPRGFLVVYLETIPRNEAGKILYAALP